MSPRRPLVALVAVTAATGLVLSGCGGSTDRAGNTPAGDPVVLTGVSPFDATEVQPFAAEVNRLSHGSITIRLRSGWHKGTVAGEADAVGYVRSGHADLGVASARAWHDLGVRGFDALIAPMVVDSFALQQSVLESQVAAQMLDSVAPLGLVGLGILPGPMRRPVGVRRDLVSAADYRSSDIGISASPVATRFFDELGAATTATGFVGAAIGGYDGVEQQIASIAGNRYDSVARSITANVALWPRPLVLVANADAMGKLTADQRDVLRRAAARSVLTASNAQQADEQEATGALCRRGALRFVDAGPADIAQLRAAGNRVRDWLSDDSATRGYLADIDGLRDHATVAASTEIVPSCDGIAPEAVTVAAPGRRTPLDGTWTMRTTMQQLKGTDDLTEGDAGGDAVPENYGEWVFVVDRGRFAFTQENGPACTWGYGTWTTEGPEVEWRFTDGGGIAPTSAANKPGELFDYGWSLYRDTLTLTRVDGAVSPGNFLAQPWHRVSQSAQPHRFFSRCGLPEVRVPR